MIILRMVDKIIFIDYIGEIKATKEANQMTLNGNTLFIGRSQKGIGLVKRHVYC